jgi:archaeosine synthase beta-subunit
VPSSYPETQATRDEWILSRRPGFDSGRNALDPLRPWAFFVEDEYSASGEVVPVATIFLTNRECPWRCLMCDLWKNTLKESVPAGAIPAQIDYALARLFPARQIKLYNSGSFFDTRAIPLGDYPAIAQRVSAFERVIVECHPALIGENCFRFKELLPGRLEVAMGLETVHPEILDRLNKRMTTGMFTSAAARLREHDIDLRVFILVKPPFMREEEALHWAQRSLDFAFDCGATAATLIPTRGGNGAMEELASLGDFCPPKLATLESALAYGINLKRGRVFADLWDLKRDDDCPQCHSARVARLREMNLRQQILDPIVCPYCGDTN